MAINSIRCAACLCYLSLHIRNALSRESVERLTIGNTM
uniref:Uncharacterized protein n=1 Tax=Arundo donax TaxID=35708 RepID=A0A0A9DIB0_ARUDO